MNGPANTGSAEEARRAVSDALTNLLEKTAAAVQTEQDEQRRKFPGMSGLPPPVSVNADVIQDFVGSPTYRQAMEAYVAGRSEQNLIVTVVRLLRELLPAVFGGI
jgi:hypothetical protein